MTEPSRKQSDSGQRHIDLGFRVAEAEVAKLETEANMAGEVVPSSAVTAWMGTTVIEVVSVVLVVVNYLFTGERWKYA